MKAQGGISYSNAAVAACPKHLLQFAVDQRYDDYTSVDHAVWRFIMRQNVFFLKEYAHKVYFQGLLDTGISFERIPRIQEMNDILAKIGWVRWPWTVLFPRRRSWNFRPTKFWSSRATCGKSITSNTRRRRTLCTKRLGTRRSLSTVSTRITCSASAKSARKQCHRKKISSSTKPSGTYRS